MSDGRVQRGRGPGLPARRPLALRYGAAAACAGLAWLSRLALDPYLGEVHPYSTFYVAVAAVSWLAGWAPAAFTAILGYVVAEYAFAGSHHALVVDGFDDAVGQVSYFVVSLAIILFAHLAQQARLQALARQIELEREVAERMRTEQALLQSREDLNRAQAVAHTGSWRLDVRRNELAWSDETHRIFGIPEGTPLTYEVFLGSIHPEDREFADRAWQAALRGQPYNIEHRIVVGGAIRWVRERAEMEFDCDGMLVGGFGTVQDITELKLIEAERAQQARRKDELVALLGHELRNPLAAISTAVHLNARDVRPDARAVLDQMLGRQVAVLHKLVDDLLDLTQVTRGPIELKRDGIDCGAFLQEVAGAVRPKTASHKQQLVLRLPPGSIRFAADRARLQQVLENLLDNAVRYTEEGGSIELSGALEGSEVVFRCKDTGRGIPWGMQEMIFEPFTRVQMALESQEPGVGIGLALVKRLVELHGGTVSAESAGPGQGSEFVVRLPLGGPPAIPAGNHGGTTLEA